MRTLAALIRRERRNSAQMSGTALYCHVKQTAMQEGTVLGIDVGFSEHRDTTCLCLLQWSSNLARLDFRKVGTDASARSAALASLIPSPVRLAAVAIDGPLTRGLRIVPHYRAPDALLSRGVFQKRGKPGQTSSPTGQKLHFHATELAKLVLAEARSGLFSIAPATHIEPISEFAVVEAFPNQFLAALRNERRLPPLHRDASDRYWECLTATNGVNQFLAEMLANCRFEIPPDQIFDHDERAAVVCALTALAVAGGVGVGVGDPDDGDIFLPPARLWGAATSDIVPWVEVALRDGIAAVQRARTSPANHANARVRLHESYWIS